MIQPLLQPSLDALSQRVDAVQSEYRELALYYMKRRREKSNFQMDLQGLRERVEWLELAVRGQEAVDRGGGKGLRVEVAGGERGKSVGLSTSKHSRLPLQPLKSLDPDPLLGHTHHGGFSFNASLTARLASTRYPIDSLKYSVNNLLPSSDLRQREAFLYPFTTTESLLAAAHSAEGKAAQVPSCSRNAPEMQKPKTANTTRAQYVGLSQYSRKRVLHRERAQRLGGTYTTEENEVSVESLPAKDYIKVARMSNRLVSDSFENI